MEFSGIFGAGGVVAVDDSFAEAFGVGVVSAESFQGGGGFECVAVTLADFFEDLFFAGAHVVVGVVGFVEAGGDEGLDVDGAHEGPVAVDNFKVGIIGAGEFDGHHDALVVGFEIGVGEDAVRDVSDEESFHDESVEDDEFLGLFVGVSFFDEHLVLAEAAASESEEVTDLVDAEVDIADAVGAAHRENEGRDAHAECALSHVFPVGHRKIGKAFELVGVGHPTADAGAVEAAKQVFVVFLGEFFSGFGGMPLVVLDIEEEHGLFVEISVQGIGGILEFQFERHELISLGGACGWRGEKKGTEKARDDGCGRDPLFY